ncbi:Hypothetical protein A7982_04239 [Minicystis rosea]|nr:Hypothetical protein A7982_04239 [Minicystis rosea]
MSLPAPIDARPKPWFLPLDRLSPSRRVLMLGGAMAIAGVWVRELVRTPGERHITAVVLVSAVVSCILANVNHAGAQLAARGVWWFHLLLGTVGALAERGLDLAIMSCGAGAALLSAWDLGLRSDEATRGPFEPVAFRRSLIVSITMAVAEVHVLTVGALLLLTTTQRALGVGVAACAVLLALGTYGIFRLRFWGVLLHLSAMFGVATLAVLALKRAHVLEMVFVWVGTVAVQMLLPLPMLLTILRRKPVRVGPPSTLPATLFAVLVTLMMGSAALAGFGAHR